MDTTAHKNSFAATKAEQSQQSPSAALLALWLKRPGIMLAASLVVVIVAALGIRNVSKDPSVDAFVPLHHPAAVARDAAKLLFGVQDPLVIGLIDPNGSSLFRPDALEALRRIHDGVRRIPGVQRSDVISLASEKAIRGADGDLLVDPILADGPIDAEAAANAAARFGAMPMLSGRLASASGDTLIIIVPVEDPNHATATYSAVRELALSEAPAGIEVAVAGVAAMNARLAQTVDTDTRIFIPAAVLVVLLLLGVALRQVKAVLGPLLVIAASAAVAVGTMGWFGAHYYLISTALPVVVMAMAVADCLHLSISYLKVRAECPQLSAHTAVHRALTYTLVPISITSLTTMAGLLGLTFAAAMQPIGEFGVFAAIGVLAAWLLSLTALPAILILTDLRPAARREKDAHWTESSVERVVSVLSLWPLRRPLLATLVLGGLVTVVGIMASQARFDYERQRYFAPGDEVREADIALGDRMGGFNFLDVMVSSTAYSNLITPDALFAIAELRKMLSDYPLVSRVSGIDEPLSLMHEVLTGAPTGSLPTAERAPAQYLFLYESGGEPDDFRHQLDYSQRNALIRAQLSTDRFSAVQPIVVALKERVAAWSATHGLDATVTGRVAVNEGWMGQLAEVHFVGLALAMALVFAVAMASFRAIAPAILALTPVLVGVLFIYALMGALGIDIAPATSMSAAIATGLGVDFGIHLVSHIRRRLGEGAALEEILGGHYLLIGRACFYSAIALGLALAVICLSSAPQLRWFGALVGAGALGSLIGALLIVPALSRFFLLPAGTVR